MKASPGEWPARSCRARRQLPQPFGDDRREQRLLGGEVAVHRPLGDAGATGDVAQVCLRPSRLERRSGRGEDFRAVALRVGAERAVVHRQSPIRS